MMPNATSNIEEPQISSSALGVVSSSCEVGSFLGSSVVPLLPLPEMSSENALVGVVERLNGYIQMVERRRLEDIERFQSQNAELRDRIVQLEKSEANLRGLGELLAVKNERLREEVKLMERRERKRDTDEQIKNIAHEAASSSECKILGTILGVTASAIGVAAGGPLAVGVLCLSAPPAIGTMIDELSDEVHKNKCKRIAFAAYQEYLSMYPYEYEKAVDFAKQKLNETLLRES